MPMCIALSVVFVHALTYPYKGCLMCEQITTRIKSFVARFKFVK